MGSSETGYLFVPPPFYTMCKIVAYLVRVHLPPILWLLEALGNPGLCLEIPECGLWWETSNWSQHCYKRAERESICSFLAARRSAWDNSLAVQQGFSMKSRCLMKRARCSFSSSLSNCCLLFIKQNITLDVNIQLWKLNFPESKCQIKASQFKINQFVSTVAIRSCTDQIRKKALWESLACNLFKGLLPHHCGLRMVTLGVHGTIAGLTAALYSREHTGVWADLWKHCVRVKQHPVDCF